MAARVQGHGYSPTPLGVPRQMAVLHTREGCDGQRSGVARVVLPRVGLRGDVLHLRELLPGTGLLRGWVPRPDETRTDAARRPPLRQDPEVQADHCQRQREYRKRCRLRRVTDHTSPGRDRSGTIVSTWTERVMSPPLAEGFGDRPRFGGPQTAIRIVCIVCGRVGVKKIDHEREKR